MEQINDSLKEQILNKKCIIHPFMKCDMLNMDENVKQHQMCHICRRENNIQDKSIISIVELLNLSSLNSSSFYKMSLEEDFKELLKSNLTLDKVLNDIDSFFIQLEEKICKNLKQQCESEKYKVLHLQQLLKRINEYYEDLHKQQDLLPIIEQFRKIIILQNPNIEEELHEFIFCNLKISQVQESLIQFYTERKQISEENNNRNEKIKEEILASIHKINFFNDSLIHLDASKKTMNLFNLFKKNEVSNEIEYIQNQNNILLKYPSDKWELQKEELDPDYNPTYQHISDYSQFLGMIEEEDKEFFFISFSGLREELPKEWLIYKNLETQIIYFVNIITGEQIEEHPVDELYRLIFQQEKKRIEEKKKRMNK